MGDDGTSRLTRAGKDVLGVAKRLVEGGVPDVRVQQWLGETRQWPILFAGTVLFIFLILRVLAGAHLPPLLAMWPDWPEKVRSDEAVDFVEAAVLNILLSYVVPKGRRDEDIELRGHTNDSTKKEQFRQAIKAENRCFWYWPWLLVFWFLLYVAFGMKTTFIHEQHQPKTGMTFFSTY